MGEGHQTSHTKQESKKTKKLKKIAVYPTHLQDS